MEKYWNTHSVKNAKLAEMINLFSMASDKKIKYYYKKLKTLMDFLMKMGKRWFLDLLIEKRVKYGTEGVFIM